MCVCVVCEYVDNNIRAQYVFILRMFVQEKSVPTADGIIFYKTIFFLVSIAPPYRNDLMSRSAGAAAVTINIFCIYR